MRNLLSRMGIHDRRDAAALLVSVLCLLALLPAVTDGLLGVTW